MIVVWWKFLPTQNSAAVSVWFNCDLFYSGAVLQVGQFFLSSYLAAIRPSSIRHRHTSRGCLWRTSHSTCTSTSTNKEGGGAKFKKKSHSSEMKDASGDKLLSVSKENRSCSLNWEGTFQEVSIVHLYLWSWAGIPVGSGCAAEGMRAWKLYQQVSLLPPVHYLCFQNQALCTQLGPEKSPS